MKPYHFMDHETLEREYSPSSCIDDIMVFINQYIDKSAEARELLNGQFEQNVKYGPEERSHFDIFMPDKAKKAANDPEIAPLPVHVFIHGGYWQELSKNESCFMAPNFLDHDVIFIALDYTLAPDATMHEIVDQTRRGMISVINNARKFGGDPENITISGSSAGGHLVAEVLSTDWNLYGFNKCPLKGALAISGVFDLEPIVNTYVNDPLKMTKEDATSLSPLHHIPDECCDIVFSVGENETSEFHRQTDEYMKACQKKGINTSYVKMPKFNHFDIVMELNKKDSPLFKAVLNQIRS
ncbi:alpha/beta hydrolase [Pseudemcibacter aquimaris]|uniref:alpha/beta hydrolase n=1 Tax=Pseudemcibacter aquimaris TaxID=2857064 RepID=UPI00201139BF|nr:alpha/beta hydrolase [Pseudemcibacter aquimaris]MCC3860517.1 alpha/beta hydrolase [Pseudemcibacter aquimaris]WDU59342.1 alpha/beta hydrolase [Pseudemcibacter aquimaris]